MRHNSEKMPERFMGRMPQVVTEGGKLLRRTARRAGTTATTVAKQGGRFIGQTVDQTGRFARRHPWTGLGAAACSGACIGACIGALLTFFYIRD